MKKVIFFTNLMVASTLLGMQNDLFHATRHSDCGAMQRILSRNDINIDAQDEEGNTALTIAFQLNAQDKMLLLLKNGADKELASKNLSNKKKKALKRLCDQIQPKGKSVNDTAASGIDLMSFVESEFLESVSNREYKEAEFLAAIAHREYEKAKRLLRREYVNSRSSTDGSTALIYAAEDGSSGMVKLLLENGAGINIQNNKGTTALIAATLDGHSDVVRILLDNEADVNMQDNNRNTALIVASQDGHAETVKELLRHKKIKVNVQNKNGSTALILAAGWNCAKVVELLLKRPDIDVNLRTTEEGATALMCAAQNGHTEIVKELLKHKNIDINIKNNDGLTAVMFASQKGYSDIVELLLKKDADVNYLGITQSRISKADSFRGLSKPRSVNDSRGDITPLMIASQDGHTETVEELLRHEKIKVNTKNSEGLTALMLASQKGHSDIVKLLLKNGADVNMQDNDGFTALTYAVQNGHTGAVEELLSHENIGVNIRKVGGLTPLMDAALYGYGDVVELLLKHKKIGVNLQANNGATALMYASQEGYSDIVKMLREKGANVNTQANNGATALLYAVRYGHIEAVQELLKYENIDVNKLYGLFGTTALFHAIQTGNAEVAKVLLSRSDIKIQGFTNSLGFTYLMFAIMNGHEDIVKLLLDKKEDVNQKTWRGFTSLMFAVDTGNARIVKLLLDQPNIDINAQNEDGETALSMAESQKYGRRIAKLIRAKLGLQPVDPFRKKVERPKNNKINEKFLDAVSRGNNNDIYSLLEENADGKIIVDVNARDKSGDTALIIAADNGNLDAVRMLLNENVNPTLKDKNGDNALIRAVKNGYLDVVDVILRKKNLINSTGRHKRTALMVAAENGKVRVVKLLIKKGAKISAKDDYGKTALDLIESKSGEDYQTIKEILKKRLAQLIDTASDSSPQMSGFDTWEISSEKCEKDLKNWEKNAPDTYKKIKSLLEMIKFDPFTGSGRPERLKGDLEGMYSIRINKQDRLVYEIDGEKVILKSCKGHYEREKRKNNRTRTNSKE